MSEPAPPASLIVPALVRQVSAAGGFATVLNKGSPYGSALLLVHRWQADVRAYERVPGPDGRPTWRLAANGTESVDSFLARQRRFDPDMWVIELDVANPERFVPDMPPVD